MNVKKLHELTGKLIKQKKGGAEIAINHSTFMESENGTILPVESAKIMRIQGADDGGPVGPKFTFLVLSGGFQNQ